MTLSNIFSVLSFWKVVFIEKERGVQCYMERFKEACSLSSFQLFTIKYTMYLMTIWWICFIDILISCDSAMSHFNLLIECLCISPLNHVVMVMRWSNFQPAFQNLGIRSRIHDSHHKESIVTEVDSYKL